MTGRITPKDLRGLALPITRVPPELAFTLKVDGTEVHVYRVYRNWLDEPYPHHFSTDQEEDGNADFFACSLVERFTGDLGDREKLEAHYKDKMQTALDDGRIKAFLYEGSPTEFWNVEWGKDKQ